MRKFWGEIKDPVHGYINITEEEKKIIDTFPMQRLRRLRQLGGAELVYPGANHTRFEHSLGVMYLAGRMTDNPNILKLITDEDAQRIRLAALLHDVGHGPFSHIFDELLMKFLRKIHEDMTIWLIQESELKDAITELGYDPKVIGKLAVGSLQEPGRTFVDQIIKSAVDVDKLDFIVRDSYHTGAKYGYVDVFRLINTIDVLEENLALELGSLSAFESFILARIECFKSIYFHRVARAGQLMIAMALKEAKDELGLVEFQSPEEYMALDDYSVWSMLKKCESSRKIIESLERRKLIKCAYTQTFFNKTMLNIFDSEQFRGQIIDQIAAEAGVKPQSVIIDVPTLPSVHSVLIEPIEVTIFHKTRDGKRVPQKLSAVSRIFDVLKGYINIFRVYTEEKDLETVGSATEKIIRDLIGSETNEVNQGRSGN